MPTSLFANSSTRWIASGFPSVAILILGSTLLYGCATPKDARQPATSSSSSAKPAGESAPPKPRTEIHLVAAEGDGQTDPISTIIDARPAALVNQKPITWGEMRESLTEAAGAQALQEVILERGLVELLKQRGLAITDDDIAQERTLFITSLNPDPNVALRLLDEVRMRQGLGSTRFRKLLWQNAALRALVRDRVEINDERIARMFELVHGPKRQARLIMTANLSDMEQVLGRLEIGEDFSDVAVEVSTDSSAARGGLLEPMSRVDETYPAAIREALWKLDTAPGSLSSPILLDTGYALLKLEKRFAASDVELSAVRPEMERLVRINQERILMDQLARNVLAGANITIIDQALNESWKRAQGMRN